MSFLYQIPYLNKQQNRAINVDIETTGVSALWQEKVTQLVTTSMSKQRKA